MITVKMNSKNMFRVNYMGLIHIAQLVVQEGVEILHLWNYKTWNKDKPIELFASDLNDNPNISIANF